MFLTALFPFKIMRHWQIKPCEWHEVPQTQTAARNAFHSLLKDADAALLHLSGDVWHGENLEELVLKPWRNAFQHHLGTVEILKVQSTDAYSLWINLNI